MSVAKKEGATVRWPLKSATAKPLSNTAQKEELVEETDVSSESDYTDDETDEDVDERAPIVLQPQQLKAEKQVYIIINRSFVFLNLSNPGAGKSYFTGYISEVYELPMIIIGITSSKPVWDKLDNEQRVEIRDFITYETLAGKKGKKLKHPYLIRVDNPKPGVKVEYTATPELVKMLEAGYLIVFDEFQKLRNPNTMYKACLAISKAVQDAAVTYKSRLAMLSGTPLSNKTKNILQIMRLIGCIGEGDLYRIDPRTNTMELIGLKKLVNYAREINRGLTDRILTTNPFQRDNIEHVCFLLFEQVVRDYITVTMPKIIDAPLDIANSFYDQDDESKLEEMKQMLAEFELKWVDKKTGNITANNFEIQHNYNFVISESARQNILVRIAIHDLVEIPNCKVIFAVNRLETISFLAEALAKWNPIIFQGKLRAKQRIEAVNAFQNDPTRRLWIGTISSMCNSISLHDIRGDAPRRMYILPGMIYLNNQQVIDRIYRQGLISAAYVRLVYIKGLEQERRIFESMTRSSEDLRHVLPEEAQKGLVFLGNLRNIEEDI